jgi:hypothetical protein
MYADEMTPELEELLDLWDQLTPDNRKAFAIVVIAIWGRDAKAQTLRSILAHIGAMNQDELDTLLVELQEPRAA